MKPFTLQPIWLIVYLHPYYHKILLWNAHFTFKKLWVLKIPLVASIILISLITMLINLVLRPLHILLLVTVIFTKVKYVLVYNFYLLSCFVWWICLPLSIKRKVFFNTSIILTLYFSFRCFRNCPKPCDSLVPLPISTISSTSYEPNLDHVPFFYPLIDTCDPNLTGNVHLMVTRNKVGTRKLKLNHCIIDST